MRHQTCTMNIDSVKKWRQEHKIVLKATASNQNEDESATLDSVLNGSQVYFPYTSFDSLRQSGEVSDILLRQCTEINGFLNCYEIIIHMASTQSLLYLV
jgi:hypothetical protein